jgi:predicted HTH transcriptional regulator
MKTARRILIVALCAIIAAPMLQSCRKGEEDPWFSFYSRKERLCQNWQFSFYKRVEQKNDSLVSYTFNGSTFSRISSNSQIISPGTMYVTFRKNGTYTWEQKITSTSSNYSYTEDGYWYFSGGNKHDEIKNKELLAMQKNSMIETFSAGGAINTTTYLGSGDLSTNVFKIIMLSYDEVKLVSEEETNIITETGTTLYKVYTEIDLKKNL